MDNKFQKEMDQERDYNLGVAAELFQNFTLEYGDEIIGLLSDKQATKFKNTLSEFRRENIGTSAAIQMLGPDILDVVTLGTTKAPKLLAKMPRLARMMGRAATSSAITQTGDSSGSLKERISKASPTQAATAAAISGSLYGASKAVGKGLKSRRMKKLGLEKDKRIALDSDLRTDKNREELYKFIEDSGAMDGAKTAFNPTTRKFEVNRDAPIPAQRDVTPDQLFDKIKEARESVGEDIGGVIDGLKKDEFQMEMFEGSSLDKISIADVRDKLADMPSKTPAYKSGRLDKKIKEVSEAPFKIKDIGPELKAKGQEVKKKAIGEYKEKVAKEKSVKKRLENIRKGLKKYGIEDSEVESMREDKISTLKKLQSQGKVDPKSKAIIQDLDKRAEMAPKFEGRNVKDVWQETSKLGNEANFLKRTMSTDSNEQSAIKKVREAMREVVKDRVGESSAENLNDFNISSKQYGDLSSSQDSLADKLNRDFLGGDNKISGRVVSPSGWQKLYGIGESIGSATLARPAENIARRAGDLDGTKTGEFLLNRAAELPAEALGGLLDEGTDNFTQEASEEEMESYRRTLAEPDYEDDNGEASEEEMESYRRTLREPDSIDIEEAVESGVNPDMVRTQLESMRENIRGVKLSRNAEDNDPDFLLKKIASAPVQERERFQLLTDQDPYDMVRGAIELGDMEALKGLNVMLVDAMPSMFPRDKYDTVNNIVALPMRPVVQRDVFLDKGLSNAEKAAKIRELNSTGRLS